MKTNYTIFNPKPIKNTEKNIFPLNILNVLVIQEKERERKNNVRKIEHVPDKRE